MKLGHSSPVSGRVRYGIDRMVRNIETGRLELLLLLVRQRQAAHAGRQGVMEQILRAAGADEGITIDRYAHLGVGAADPSPEGNTHG